MLISESFFLTADRFLAGMILGVVVYMLRQCIDRWKDSILEITTLILTICILAVSCLPQADSLYAFGLALSQRLQFLFWILPLILGIRAYEKIKQREVLGIVDLFRMTSIIALAVFGATSLPATTNPLNVVVVMLIYLVGEQACSSKTPARFVSLAFSIGFVLSAITVSIFKTSILELFQMGQTRFSARTEGALTLCAIVLPIAVTPVLLDWLAKRWALLHRMAHRFAAWRFGISNPQDNIRGSISSILWRFENATCYLNHGSFGAVPQRVRDEQAAMQNRCSDQPMKFLAREQEKAWRNARFQLATFVGSPEENLAFCENATSGMNEVANSFPLSAGEEVLLNNHEYGAVRRIWERKCKAAGARLKSVDLPIDSQSHQEICSSILEACTANTRLVVLSHITSPTAIRLPVESICQGLKSRGIASCIDGPHAILQEKLRLHQLDCDFYTASCHKWLCAPIGSGFVYAKPSWQKQFNPTRLSWGRLPPNQPESWSEEMIWTGTRDYTPYFAVANAIRFFESFGRERIDERNHSLACYARQKLLAIRGTQPVTPESREWFGWMVGVWLPEGDHSTLQKRLQANYKIEIPIVNFEDRYLIRVSCPLYIDSRDIDFLVYALSKEL